MHAKQFVLTGLLVVLLVPTGLFAEPKIRVKVISDFEGKSELTGWYISGKSKKDWAEASEIHLEESSEWASEGKQSAKLVFDSYERGEGSWRVIKRWLPKDWRGWDTFEFDLYNPGSHKAMVRVDIYQGSKKLFDERDFEPGTWHITIPIRESGNPDADLSQMTLMRVCMLEPKRKTTIFMDNFRLVDRSQIYLEQLVNRLLSAARFDSKRSNQYHALLKKVKHIESVLSSTDDLGEREKHITKMYKLRNEVNELLVLSAKDTAERVADNLATGSLSSTDHRVRLGVADTTEERNKADYLGSFVEVTQERLARSRLTAAMSEHFPDADFAVGIPSAPITLAKRPMTYSGPLKQIVYIDAARREYEPFQLVILPRKHDLKDIRLIASDFTGPGTLSAEHIEIAPMGWRTHPRDGKTRADMLRSDIKKFDVPVGVQQPVWINVYVPENTLPGDYHGEVRITSTNAKEQVIKVTLTVWPFTLPRYPSLSTGIHGWGRRGELADVNAKFIIAHRLSPSSIYQFTPMIPLETYQRWHDWGGTDFNPLRISRMGGAFVANDAGELRVSPSRRNFFIENLDPWMKHMKKTNPDFLRHCYLYGFDELLGNHIPAMEAIYGELKQRYGPIRTAAAFHLPLWEEYSDIRNLDIWIIIARLITPQLRDHLHTKGHKVWWYNLYTDNRDPVGCRVQFWATFKDRLDGVLHWNLRKGGGENPYGPELDTPSERAKDKFAWGGLVRRNPEGLPVSTVALEYWREGLEDCDYLYILRDLRDELAQKPEALEKHKYLITAADRMISVPETITVGIIRGKQNEKGEITRGFSNHTKRMEDILTARRHVAELIIQLQEILVSYNK